MAMLGHRKLPLDFPIALIIGLFLLGPQTAVSAEYLLEVSGGRQRTDFGLAGETDSRVLQAAYYFGGVDDSRGPLALAPFLGRSSFASVEIRRDESDPTVSLATGTSSLGSAEETKLAALGGRYVWQSGWFLAARIQDGDGDPPPSQFSTRDIKLEEYSFSVGRFLGTTLRIDAAWRSTKLRNEITAFTCLPVPAPVNCLSPIGYQIDGEEYSIRSMFVGPLRSLTYALTGQVTATRSEIGVIATTVAPALEPTQPVGALSFGSFVAARAVPIAPAQFGRSKTYSIGGELYLTPNLGVRLSYLRSDGDSTLDKSYGLATTWFLRRNFAVRLEVARAEYELGAISLENANTAEMSVLARF